MKRGGGGGCFLLIGQVFSIKSIFVSRIEFALHNKSLINNNMNDKNTHYFNEDNQRERNDDDFYLFNLWMRPNRTTPDFRMKMNFAFYLALDDCVDSSRLSLRNVAHR